MDRERLAAIRARFHELPWHDAELRSLRIVRVPGESETVRLEVAWPDDDGAAILFQGCRRVEATMHLDGDPPESIVSSTCDWGAQIVPSGSPLGRGWQSLLRFRLETNYGTTVTIFATDFGEATS